MARSVKTLLSIIFLLIVSNTYAQTLFSGIKEPKSIYDLQGETIVIMMEDNSGVYATKDNDCFYWEKADTVWIKKVKKPKLNKHYKLVQRHYHWEDSRTGESTPVQYILNNEFKVLSIDNTEFLSIVETTRIHLQNVQNGELFYWELGIRGDISYIYMKIFIERFGIESISSLECRDLYIASPDFGIHRDDDNLFMSVGAHSSYSIEDYQYFHLDKIDYFIDLHYTKNGFDIKNRHYKYYGTLGEKQIAFDISDVSVISVEEYNRKQEQRIHELANKGHYSAHLTKVQKPANSRIRQGRISTDEVDTDYIYSDNYITIALGVLEKGISMILQNKTNYSMKVIWDDAAFLDTGGVAHRIIHQGVRYAEISQPQASTLIPANSIINDSLVPAGSIRYSSYLGEWVVDSLIKGRNTFGNYGKDAKVGLLLPIQISGVTNEYKFTFDLVWEYDHPEIREEYLKTHPEE